MLPSKFLSLSDEEKAFIIASIDVKIDHEKEEAKKMKAKSKKR